MYFEQTMCTNKRQRTSAAIRLCLVFGKPTANFKIWYTSYSILLPSYILVLIDGENLLSSDCKSCPQYRVKCAKNTQSTIYQYYTSKYVQICEMSHEYFLVEVEVILNIAISNN